MSAPKAKKSVEGQSPRHRHVWEPLRRSLESDPPARVDYCGCGRKREIPLTPEELTTVEVLTNAHAST
jgi:hypothetical protein